MAKVKTRLELETLAQDQVRTDARVLAVTARDVEAESWAKMQARAMALMPLPGDADRVPDKWGGVYAMLRVDKMLEMWSRKVKDLRAERQSFEHAGQGISVDDATTKIEALVQEFNLRGVVRMDFNGFGGSVEVLRGVDIECRTYFRLERGESSADPDGKKPDVRHYRLQSDVSWSATSRSAAIALANARLYAEMAEMAMEVEVRMAGENVIFAG